MIEQGKGGSVKKKAKQYEQELLYHKFITLHSQLIRNTPESGAQVIDEVIGQAAVTRDVLAVLLDQARVELNEDISMKFGLA